jgi:uncharacterized OsmC-like protein/pimeloyl-ACP methyl ester carboxylesterase
MPSTQRIEFDNHAGVPLAAALALPDRAPRAWALFAHCFTCGKSNAAASRIARTMAAGGWAVMRFDFTGLGGSGGDFANSGFTANVDDLVAAADYLRAQHQPPSLLIGHSLGGTAALAAAARIKEVRAVATIGAPATPAHVIRHFQQAVAQIERDGSAEVDIAGRTFRIARRFLEDTRDADVLAGLGSLRRALLILHSPVDEIVSIDEASRLFQAAKHPKSFVSLDQADHLLSRLADAQYVAGTVSAWAERYLLDEKPGEGSETAVQKAAGGEVVVTEGNDRFLREVTSDDHHWLADEPVRAGGDNLGPDPYEHLLAALGTCTSMTIRMVANRKGWPLDHVTVRLSHRREHDQDCADCERRDAKIDVIERTVRLEGSLDAEQRKKLLEVADRCPVHRTLTGRLRIDTVADDSP